MIEHELTPDTQAILLLCGTFGRRGSSVAPLSAAEYHALALWLHAQQMRPGDLLRPEGVACIQSTPGAPVSQERLLALLARGGALALTVEGWSNKGLWVMSRSDPDYPQRLRARLERIAPPLLYGAGNRRLLQNGGLAIVGSRRITEDAIAFTCDIARRCAIQLFGWGAGVVSTHLHLRYCPQVRHTGHTGHLWRRAGGGQRSDAGSACSRWRCGRRACG